jgi:hypothetical protein
MYATETGTYIHSNYWPKVEGAEIFMRSALARKIAQKQRYLLIVIINLKVVVVLQLPFANNSLFKAPIIAISSSHWSGSRPGNVIVPFVVFSA